MNIYNLVKCICFVNVSRHIRNELKWIWNEFLSAYIKLMINWIQKGFFRILLVLLVMKNACELEMLKFLYDTKAVTYTVKFLNRVWWRRIFKCLSLEPIVEHWQFESIIHLLLCTHSTHRFGILYKEYSMLLRWWSLVLTMEHQTTITDRESLVAESLM